MRAEDINHADYILDDISLLEKGDIRNVFEIKNNYLIVFFIVLCYSINELIFYSLIVNICIVFWFELFWLLS